MSANSILEGLPPTTHTYPYTGPEEFLDTLTEEYGLWQSNTSNSEYVVFTNVNEKTFNQDFVNSDDNLLASWDSYCASSQVLVAKMHSKTHEDAVFNLTILTADKLGPMGLKHALQRTGRHGIREGDRAKEPDNGFYPRRLPQGRTNKWPSIALEVAYSESESKLAKDVEWWLTQSSGDVKATISFSINKTSKEIVLEEWELVEADTGKEARSQQRVTIVQPAGQDAITVTSAPFTIRFESLMLRSAERSEEKDIDLTEDDLKLLAQLVWQTQES
jgi:hypothetical protein